MRESLRTLSGIGTSQSRISFPLLSQASPNINLHTSSGAGEILLKLVRHFSNSGKLFNLKLKRGT